MGPPRFTDYGVQLIEETTSIEALVNRTVVNPVRVSLNVLPDARGGSAQEHRWSIQAVGDPSQPQAARY